jgi:VCBS repeat-containing protein
MPSVTSTSSTGNPYIDGILTGTRWSSGSITFSFPTDGSQYGSGYGSGENTNAFEAFTAQQQDAVRAVLTMFSSVANLTFTEVTETSSSHGTLRYAETDAVRTAWGYYPNSSATGGDMWFANASNLYDNPVRGNYAFLTMMHETGHALGLDHAHESTGGFGAVPVDRDSLEYTVMSYRSYVGAPLGGYTSGSSSYPQSLMMYDIAALQHMYGANYTTNAGDSVYQWSQTTGQMSINGVGQGVLAGNRIFLTIWDGGGNDTYDFSNYTTTVDVDLRPGEWTTASSAQLASLGSGHYAAGNIANALLFNNNTASLIENAVGGVGSDVLTGNQAHNRFTGNAGNDLLDGGIGSDTAVFSGLQSDYIWAANVDGSWTVTDLRGALDGTDTLWNIEVLQFADTLYQLVDGGTPQTPAPNAAPIFTSAAQTTSVAEWADNSANELANTLHTVSNTLSFSDANVDDVHAATFTARGTGYLGTFAVTGVNDANGSVNWTFNVADNVMDYLAAGQTLTQRYDVTIDDGRGGLATQMVTVNLVGAGDGSTTSSKKGKGSGRGNGNDDDADSHGGGEEDLHLDQAPAPVFSPALTHIPDIALTGVSHHLSYECIA